MRRGVNLDVQMLFEPSLIIAQLLEIKSAVSPNFNGQYKVIGFNHNCLISKTQAGNRITTANLWIGPLLPGADINLTNNQTQGGFNKVKGSEISTVLINQPSAVREVYQYIQRTGRAPHTKITNNIYWDEVVKILHCLMKNRPCKFFQIYIKQLSAFKYLLILISRNENNSNKRVEVKKI